jgi:hypothetical protein
LRNVTVASNVADSDGDGIGGGGGVSVAAFFSAVSNSILAGNLAGAVGSECRGTLASEGHNLIQDPSGCTIAGDTTGNLLGVDPLLGPLADNGGPTQTRALLPGSPALNAGDPAVPGSGKTACEPTDQRGVDRPQQLRCDIGAFEAACNGGDTDGDEVCDAEDNCPATANPDQNDLDDDGIGDVCDADDSTLALLRLNLRPDGRTARATGSVFVKGSLLTAAPRYPLPHPTLEVEIQDGRGLHEVFSFADRHCSLSPRGSRMVCRSDDGNFAVSFRRARGSRTLYVFRIRVGGLSAAPPLVGPVLVAIRDTASVDRIGTIATCRPARRGGLKCP